MKLAKSAINKQQTGSSSGGGRSGTGFQRKETTPLTAEEKAARMNKILNNFASSKTTSDASQVFVNLWEADVNNVELGVDSKGCLTIHYNVTRDGKVIKSRECYIVFGQAMYTHLHGAGGRYPDKSPELTKFADYHYQVTVVMQTAIPDDILAYNPNASKEMAAQMAFLLARKKKIIDFCMETETVFTELMAPIRRNAAKKVRKDSDVPVKDQMNEYMREFVDDPRNGVNLGMQETIRVDEDDVGDNGKPREHPVIMLKTKTLTFVENYSGRGVPADVTAEIEAGNVYTLPVAEFIVRAYEEGLCLKRIMILNPDQTKRETNLFKPPVRNGSWITGCVMSNAYINGKNQGVTPLLKNLQVIKDAVYVGDDAEELKMAGSHFAAPRPITDHQYEILVLLKTNAAKVDGVTADTVKAILVDAKPPKMKADDLTTALLSLMTAHFVVNGKDDKHFKLMNPLINVDALPREPPPISFTSGEADDKKSSALVKRSLTDDDDDDDDGSVKRQKK